MPPPPSRRWPWPTKPDRPSFVVDRPKLHFPVLLKRAPPSVRLTYAALRLRMGRDANEIAESSGLPPRTVRYAVRWLIDEGLVVRRPRLDDTRRHVLVPAAEDQGLPVVEVTA